MKTVLLIGASRGIGLELARQYSTDGWRVIATARTDEGLYALKTLGVQALRVDVVDPANISALALQLDGEKLDLAIYVAGVADRSNTRTAPTQTLFDHVMHTNILGAMMALPQIAPKVEAAQGIFAFISSHYGSLEKTQSSDAVLYRMSKAALNMLMRCGAHDYPKACCVALHPGWVKTEMGGEQAPLSVAQSVSHLRSTLADLSLKQTGQFLSYDGSSLPW